MLPTSSSQPWWMSTPTMRKIPLGAAYAHRQLFDLIQNSADALADTAAGGAHRHPPHRFLSVLRRRWEADRPYWREIADVLPLVSQAGHHPDRPVWGRLQVRARRYRRAGSSSAAQARSVSTAVGQSSGYGVSHRTPHGTRRSACPNPLIQTRTENRIPFCAS